MSKLSAAARKLRWSIERRGILGTLKTLGAFRAGLASGRAATNAVHPFDLKHGVATSGLVDGVALFTGHKHDAFSTAYWGVSPSRARSLLRHWAELLPQRDPSDYTFVDVGCGKGRMLLLASKLPFRRVIGLELNGALASIAATNALVWAATQKSIAPIEVLHQDATEITRPNGPCVFFLYNPFGATVLRKLLDRLDAATPVAKGDTEFIYLHPEFDEVFATREGYLGLWKGHIPQTEDGNDDDVEDVVAGGFQACNLYRH